MIVLSSVIMWPATVTWAQEKRGRGGRIGAIVVRGNTRIEETTIRAKITARVGEPVSPEATRQDIKAIYRLGYFEDVRVEVEPLADEVRLVYLVREHPFVTEIVFEGNHEVETERLKERLALKPQAFLEPERMAEQAERLRRHYEDEGFPGVTVIPVIARQPDGEARLTFFITEGEQAKIREITFEGTRALPTSALREALVLKRDGGVGVWVSGASHYRREIAEADVERLRNLYQDHGYLQVQVGEPRAVLREVEDCRRVIVWAGLPEEPRTVCTRRHWWFVTFTVREGDQYQVSHVAIQGHEAIPLLELREAVKTREGDRFSRAKLRDDMGRITDLYGERGYAFAVVTPQFTPDASRRTVEITLRVREGLPVRVREIRIAGNDKTRDKVIRREMRVYEQELLNTPALRKSYQRINNLNFFEQIEIAPEQVGRDQVDLTVRVKEKSTGSLSIGAGYSSVDLLTMQIQTSEGNLFGRGQLLRLSAELGQRRTTYSATFREPYLMDRPVSGSVTVFDQVRSFFTYREKRRGAELGLGHSFTDEVSGGVTYGWEATELTDISPGIPFQLTKDSGARTLSLVGVSLARDTRDFWFDPHQGTRLFTSAEYAGFFLGGNQAFYRFRGDASRFIPLWWDTVFSLHGLAGYAQGHAGQVLPLGERFFVGGINTVRGFTFGTAGPLSRLPDQAPDILGGNKQLIFNAEYLFDLVKEAKLKIVTFFDAGTAFNDDQDFNLGRIRYGAGWGIRWVTPVGPLRLEWGANLFPRPGESPSALEFTIGTLF